MALTRSAFIKPPSEKSLPSVVDADGAQLPRSGSGIGPATTVLTSNVVTFAVEYRLFVLDRQIMAGSRYVVYGRLDVAPLVRDCMNVQFMPLSTNCYCGR
jgi:ATP-grasp domain, R2K clade family 2